MVESVPHTGVAGIRCDDVVRLELALDGVGYPVDKWQLIDHAERDPAGEGQAHRRAIGLLWALPTGRYVGLTHVLTGAARTCRGHPRRENPEPVGIG